MSAIIMEHARVVLPDRVAGDFAVRVRDGRIAAVAPAAYLPPQPGEQAGDAAGGFLAPGFIDLHIHGSGRFLVDAGPAGLAGLAELLFHPMSAGRRR